MFDVVGIFSLTNRRAVGHKTNSGTKRKQREWEERKREKERERKNREWEERQRNRKR